MSTEATPAPAAQITPPGNVAYDRCGTGPPLVLIHGLGGERHVWQPVIDLISGEREIVTLDLPGFGGSAPLPDGDDVAPAALAASIGGLIDALGLDRPHVAGNSLGGWVALELAKQDLVASVTAIAPAGFWSRPLGPKPYAMRNLSRALRPLLPLLLRSRRVRHFALSGSVAHPERVPREAAVRIALAYADAPGFVAVNNAMRAGHLTGGERIRVPVTIGWCEFDRLVRRPRVMPVRARREVLLEDCGHVPMYDDPGAIARLLLQGSAA
jgi:pimeloyl-ACP methyl ester carboxylesterase